VRVQRITEAPGFVKKLEGFDRFNCCRLFEKNSPTNQQALGMERKLSTCVAEDVTVSWTSLAQPLSMGKSAPVTGIRQPGYGGYPGTVAVQ
jgi:hypothetical protein